MAISINWGTKVITVPQADLLLVQASPTAVYELNINDFRLELRDLEDDPAGMPHPDTHTYYPPVTVSGVTIARVVEIINGYTVVFDPDTAYGVNIVGGNSNIADVTTNTVTQIRTANSAGLQDADSLQAASFLGAVAIDPTSSITGTTFPRGTQGFPVNNIADAHEIAEERGISKFLVMNDLTLGIGDTLADGYVFFAQKNDVTVTINAAADVTNAAFEWLTVTGTLDANNLFRNCEVYDAVSLQAVLLTCGISGTITLGGGETRLVNCHSDVAGGGVGQYPTINMGGTGSDLLVRDWSGGIALENMADANAAVSLDIDSGRVYLASTMTVGTVTIRGNAEILDDSLGVTINDKTLQTHVRRESVNAAWGARGPWPEGP